MRFQVITAALALGVALPATAQQLKQITAEQAIAALDADTDGKVSLQEFLHFQAARMPEFDKDGDGILDKKEFKASLQGKEQIKNAERAFIGFNNEDNKRGLTQREFLGYHAYVFNNRIDKDKDGFMTAAEWDELMGRS